jgi:hypothetical protein
VFSIFRFEKKYFQYSVEYSICYNCDAQLTRVTRNDWARTLSIDQFSSSFTTSEPQLKPEFWNSINRSWWSFKLWMRAARALCLSRLSSLMTEAVSLCAGSCSGLRRISGSCGHGGDAQTSVPFNCSVAPLGLKDGEPVRTMALPANSDVAGGGARGMEDIPSWTRALFGNLGVYMQNISMAINIIAIQTRGHIQSIECYLEIMNNRDPN